MSGTWDQETTICDQSNKNNTFRKITNQNISHYYLFTGTKCQDSFEM